MPPTAEFSHEDYEIDTREVLFQGSFLRLARYSIKHRLFNGNWSPIFKCEVLERKSAVAILPYDPLLDRVILIKQFRPGALSDPQSPWLLEIPAGVIEENENLEKVAYREMIEEIGYKPSLLHPISEFFVSPGAANEYLHLYCGKVDARTIEGVHGIKNENEDIYALNLPAEEAFAKLYSGQIKTVPAIVALMWLQIHRKELQAKWEK
ncbi:MAG: nudF [Gammaproteobacteria bacterium]|jgi:ADP-ribose pyrophosphatase|nr:nudF [Gammaproteobacteria bacterium]